ncbi:conserved hypothetical protein [uncultured spirochete]|jgi:AcrR family transcriptional regulator|uniref:HTH tetR-type domain-containing protein n=1 Tax=uncultured spirochete TaxID=156406 RepID=A0A3P3XR74_9SPIR|nr:conserved hypothetical protein [uncultured spirochete]
MKKIKEAEGRGRPRDVTRDTVILEVTIQGLVELGYERLSINEIASLAKASKSTIYRRWSSKATLVADAVAYWMEKSVPLETPNTKSLTDDITLIVSVVPDGDAFRNAVTVFLDLASVGIRHEELRSAISHEILEGRRQQLREVINNAIARGEIAASAKTAQIPNMVIGLILVHMLTDRLCGRDDIHRLVESVIEPLRKKS